MAQGPRERGRKGRQRAGAEEARQMGHPKAWEHPTVGDPRGEGSRTAHLREEHRMGPGGARWTARRREQGQMEQGQMGQHPMAGAEEEHLTA